MAFLKAPVRSREPKAKGGNRTVALLLFTLPGRQLPDLRRVGSPSRNSRPGRAAI
jgi:hypothetical protein